MGPPIALTHRFTQSAIKASNRSIKEPRFVKRTFPQMAPHKSS